MFKCQENLKAIRNQLDFLLKAVNHRVREQAPVDECVDPNNVEMEEEALYTIVEREDLRVNCQQEIEVKGKEEASTKLGT